MSISNIVQTQIDAINGACPAFKDLGTAFYEMLGLLLSCATADPDDLSAQCNGTNKVFTVTAGKYADETVRVYVNNLPEFSFTETNSSTGVVTLNTAPKSDDTVIMLYGQYVD